MQATIEILNGHRIPEALRELTDAPERLHVWGALPEERPVAIVGTRRPSGYGRRTAGLLASRLATAGVPVVSGLAFGIDTCVHRAVVDAGGRSVAVLPGGVDRESVSPRSNLGLADRIVAAGGAVVSELPNGTTARKHYYASRNRLISGLARAVVVVEATIPSGSLVTAQHAADQSRELWAVPGLIEAPAAAGTNRLIRDGAQPLVSIDEFMETLGVTTRRPEAGSLVGEFSERPVHIDELAGRLKLPVSELEAELLKLELRGAVRREVDGTYVRI